MATKPEDEGSPYFFSLTEKRRLDPSDRGARVARDPSYPDSIRSSPLGPVFPKLDAAGDARLMARLPSLLDGPVVKTLPEPGDPIDHTKSAAAEPLVPDDFFGPDPNAAQNAAPAPLPEPALAPEPPPPMAAAPPAADSAEPAILPLPMTAQAHEETIVPSVSYARPRRWPWLLAGISALAAAAVILIVIATSKHTKPAKAAAATAAVTATAAEPAHTASPVVPPPPPETAAPTATATATAATATATATATTSPSSTATSTVATSPKGETGTGTLITSAVPGGHRLFIDNKFVGVTGRPVTVKCGKHNVRVGGKGDAKDYDVPCGGEITIH